MPSITQTPAASRSPLTSEPGGVTSNWLDVLALEFDTGEAFELELIVYPSFDSIGEALQRSTWGRVYLELSIGKGVPGSGGEHRANMFLPSCGLRSRFPAKWLRLRARTQADPTDPTFGTALLSCFLVASATPVIGTSSPIEFDTVTLAGWMPFGGPVPLGGSAEVPKGAREARVSSWQPGGVITWFDPAGFPVASTPAGRAGWVPVPREAHTVRFATMEQGRAQVEFR